MMFHVEETIRSRKSIRSYLAAEESALAGFFSRLSETGVTVPEHMKYLFSWVKER